ncbi:MAG: hypothetical protein GY771_14065 [bacterium]|nr:hypothetical protein [bacterium]
MATLNEIFKWVFQNIAPGETDPDKRVDADRVMDNYYTLRDIVAVVEAQGVNADESNATNGASTAVQANLTIRTDEGEIGLLDEDDWVQVWDGGSDYWYLRNTVGDDELSFSDTHLSSGSGPADYSDSGFIDGLIIKTIKFRDKVGKNDIIISGAHMDLLSATDLQISAADATKIGTAYADTKDTVDNVTSGTGSGAVIAAEKVEATSLKKSGIDAILADDSPRNLSRGMFDNALYSNELLYGLQKTQAPANDYGLETTIVKAGSVSQKFSSNGSAQGIEVLLDELIDHDLLAGKKITIVAWIRSSDADKLDLGFYDDDSGYQVTNVAYAADTWTKVSVTVTAGTGATEVRGVIRSTDASSTDHYVDIAGIYIGETAFDPTAPSVYASTVNHALNNRVYNYIPFSDLAGEDSGKEPGHAWLNGSSSPPVGWDGTGDTTADDSNYYIGGRGWGIELDAGEYFRHYLGIDPVGGRIGPLHEIVGKPVTFGLWLKKDGANTEDLDLIIEEYVGSSWSEVASNRFAVNDYDVFSQIAVTGEINPNADFVRILIKNNGSAAISAYIDALMFTQTAHPIGYTSLTPWQYHAERFAMSGSLSDGLMSQNGIAAEVPIGINCIAYGMTVSEQTSGTGTDSFYPRVGGGDETDLQIDLGNGENYESVHDHNGVVISSGDTLGVYCDAHNVTPGQDAFAVVHCLTWGI